MSFVADTDNADVQELNASDGSFVQEVHTFGPGNADSFQDPIGISVGHNASNAEEILVSDGVTGNVYVFNTSFALSVHDPANPAHQCHRGYTRRSDRLGRQHLHRRLSGQRGRRVRRDGQHRRIPIRSWGAASGCDDVAKPYGIDIDTADTPNRIYVASSDLEEVKVFDDSGNCLNVGATGSQRHRRRGTCPRIPPRSSSCAGSPSAPGLIR